MTPAEFTRLRSLLIDEIGERRACRRLDRDYWGDLLAYVVDLDDAAFMAAALAADYLGTPWLPEARFLSAPEPELEAVLLAALRAAWEPGK